MAISIERLRAVPLFAALSDEQLAWLASHGEEREIGADEALFAEGDWPTHFFVLLSGELQVSKRIGDADMVLVTHQPGAFTGEIPLLSGTRNVASLRALRQSRLLALGPADFEAMLTVCPPTVGTIMRTLATRIQIVDNTVQQHEKLASLGTLAAGLAHELNNPAAAAHRAAGQLREQVIGLQERALPLAAALDAGQLRCLGEAQSRIVAAAAAAPQLDSITRRDREEALLAWLEAHGVADAWELAPSLVEAGLDVPHLADLADAAGVEALDHALPWIAGTLDAAGLLGTIEQSTARISTLVQAIRSYSYMDQAPVQEVDVHEGLESTLIILGHKLKGIAVTREYAADLPRISAYGSELNQVWTNLIDNAADALAGQGRIWVRTRREGDQVLIEIADDGPGIPPEVQPRIFEPFFTTKGVGKGTGLGLDISYRIVVRQHHGAISVQSRQGDTRFLVRLPMAGV